MDGRVIFIRIISRLGADASQQELDLERIWLVRDYLNCLIRYYENTIYPTVLIVPNISQIDR